ncbi:hypothetical protein AAMO2058_000190200 [Amorphochlora amoebiformis]
MRRWHSLLYLSLSFAFKTVPRLTRLSSPPIFYRPKQTPLQSKNRILHGVRSMSVRADGGERGPRGAEGREIEGVCAIMVRVSGVPGGSAEEFCDELIEQGADTASLEEQLGEGEEASPIFGSLSAGNIWNKVTVKVYFPPDSKAIAICERVAAQVGIDEGTSFKAEEVETADWVANIMDSYQPTQVLPDLWIIPEWSEPKDLSARNIILTPGLAFGTGDHPTTRLCLGFLNNHQEVVKGKSVLDMGTGSGVLAISAALQGASRVVGIDVDPISVAAAIRNANLNNVQNTVTILESKESPELEGFDLVVANIHMHVLMSLKDSLGDATKPGGTLALSGILVDQIKSIEDAFASVGFGAFESKEDEGWVLLRATKL